MMSIMSVLPPIVHVQDVMNNFVLLNQMRSIMAVLPPVVYIQDVMNSFCAFLISKISNDNI